MHFRTPPSLLTRLNKPTQAVREEFFLKQFSIKWDKTFWKNISSCTSLIESFTFQKASSYFLDFLACESVYSNGIQMHMKYSWRLCLTFRIDMSIWKQWIICTRTSCFSLWRLIKSLVYDCELQPRCHNGLQKWL